LYVDVNEHLCG
jgi:hypothetical protein